MHLLDMTMYYALHGGGISSYLNAKAHWLARHSTIRHTIVTSSMAPEQAGASVIALPGRALPGINGYRVPRSLRSPLQVCERCRPDVIEVGDAGPFALSALAARRRFGMPVVGFYHSDLHALVAQRFGAAGAALARRYLARVYGQCDLVLAPSRQMVARLKQLGVRDPVYQPLGVDAGVFCPARRDPALRRRLGLAPETRLLVYAGRFTPQKKLHLLAGAMQRLGRPYHLLLVGGGGEPPPIPRSTVLPFVTEPQRLAALLGGCDLFVHPADGETFGLVALEAMACGVPVLGTGGGVAELIDHHTGLVVAPDSAAALAEGIAALFESGPGRCLASLAGNARRQACDIYDWNHIMPQLIERYARLAPINHADDFFRRRVPSSKG
ncbi:alpha-1,6-mannosyltransferase [Duganella sp. 3397]|uniref:glycosyltransferase n=1 Tax=Duganella sp. 3397 TaxID=2817732 RepID=UPI002856ED09|nr:glycosyltransferase [Duganella sp. 3397]MDR7051239.1 alpha-1,6-mannosyltransferase [Duganella sp. 3397]